MAGQASLPEGSFRRLVSKSQISHVQSEKKACLFDCTKNSKSFSMYIHPRRKTLLLFFSNPLFAMTRFCWQAPSQACILNACTRASRTSLCTALSTYLRVCGFGPYAYNAVVARLPFSGLLIVFHSKGTHARRVERRSQQKGISSMDTP